MGARRRGRDHLLGHLGAIGAIPGWPGAEVFPAQPMVSQMRAVLDRFAAAGGTYREVKLAGIGHSPHLEVPEQFAQILADLYLDT